MDPCFLLREFLVNVPQCYSLDYKVVKSKNDDSLPDGFNEQNFTPENGFMAVRPINTRDPAKYKFFIDIESNKILIDQFGPYFLYLVDSDEELSQDDLLALA